MKTEICRLCLNQTISSFSLLKNRSDEMLESLTAIKLEESDSFPTVSCLKCLLNLKLAFKIQQNFLEADTRLKENGLENFQIKEEKIILQETAFNEMVERHLCTICGKLFDNMKEYKAHCLTHDFKSKDMEDVVLEAKNNIQDVKQKPCESLEDKVNELRERGFSEKTLEKFVKLSKHKKVRRVSLMRLVCETCGKVCVSRSQYRNHIRIHSDNRKQCPVCSKRVTCDNFSKHLRIHTDKPQICDRCGRTFANVESLRGHVFHSHSDRHYECKECKIVFKNDQQLSTHKRKSHTGTRHVCETCGRKFFYAYDLKKHINGTHLKIRSYKCEFCEKLFSGPNSLKTHRRQHTSEAPYRCEVCGEGFRQNVSLKAHQKSKHNIVEAITSFCKECGKGFASEHAVKAHMRLH